MAAIVAVAARPRRDEHDLIPFTHVGYLSATRHNSSCVFMSKSRRRRPFGMSTPKRLEVRAAGQGRSDFQDNLIGLWLWNRNLAERELFRPQKKNGLHGVGFHHNNGRT